MTEEQNDRTQTHVVLTKGTMVAHYRISEKIGAGGMGEVYLAEDTELGRRVALKFLPLNLAAENEHRARFKREAQAAAKLNHPNIVTIHEVSEFNGRPYIVMEHVEGRSLHHFCHDEQLPTNKIIDIAIQICDGLSKAHQAGIVHRDIKSSNIVVDSDGHPKILDFGLAIFKGSEEVTKAGSTIGTVSYMSPEQAQGQKIDHRSDLFSFGIVLYELIAGRTPFKRDSDAATLKSIVNDTAEPLTRYRAEVPDELQRIVNKLLQRDPSLRYQNAADITADLKLLAISGSSPAVPAYRKKTNRKFMVIGAAGLALAATIIVYMMMPFGQSSTDSGTPMLVVLPFENLGQAEDAYFASGITDEITSRLASIAGIGVISRTSALKYGDGTKTVKEIGKELGVDYVLEGTIRWDKSGDIDRVRITPQLIRVADDRHIWSENYERALTQIFVVQADIAVSIAKALDITLTGQGEVLSSSAQPTTNMEAYDFYLRGKDYDQNGTSEKDRELSIQMFEKAVELDSTFYQAHYHLARILSHMYFSFRAGPEILVKAKNAADAAMRFAGGAPEGQMAMGYYYYYGSRDYERALEMFQTALEKQPNNSDLLVAIGYVLRRQGKIKEAAEHQLRGIELDPHSANKAFNTITTLFYLRKYDDIIEMAERQRSLRPDNGGAYSVLYYATFCKTGSIDAAHKLIEQSAEYVDPTNSEIRDIQQKHYRLSRQFDAALKHLSLSNDASNQDSIGYYIGCAENYYFLKDKVQTQIYADSAKIILERVIMSGFPAPEIHNKLGTAYAYLGRKDDARAQAEKAMQMLPISRDYMRGMEVFVSAMVVSVLIGDYEKALDGMEFVLSNPSFGNVNFLKLRPGFDPLRDHPRYKALIEKYDKPL